MIDFYLKDSAFTAVKRDAKVETRYLKGVPFVNRRYKEGVPFSCKRVRGWSTGQSFPVKAFVEYPPPSRGILTQSFMLLAKHVVRSVYLYSALHVRESKTVMDFRIPRRGFRIPGS